MNLSPLRPQANRAANTRVIPQIVLIVDPVRLVRNYSKNKHPIPWAFKCLPRELNLLSVSDALRASSAAEVNHELLHWTVVRAC